MHLTVCQTVFTYKKKTLFQENDVNICTQFIHTHLIAPTVKCKYDEMAFLTSRNPNKHTLLALGVNRTARCGYDYFSYHAKYTRPLLCKQCVKVQKAKCCN